MGKFHKFYFVVLPQILCVLLRQLAGSLPSLFTVRCRQADAKTAFFDGKGFCSRFRHRPVDGIELQRMLEAWNAEMTKLKNKKITQEEYDRWRYHYPKYDISGKFRKVGPSQELSDYLVSKFKDIL